MRKRRPIKQTQPARAITGEHKGAPAFILAADDHIRNGAPECRTDNYVEAIFKKIAFRNETARKYNIPILHSGDLGDKNYFVKDGNGWTASLYNMFIEYMQNIKLYCVAGNHDLPNHDIGHLCDSALGGLIESKTIEILYNTDNSDRIGCQNIHVYGCSWDCGIPKPEPEPSDDKNILVIHKMIINQLPLWPGQEAPKAQEILIQNPGYDLIVSGDNHNTFISEYQGRLLVNPGSMVRSSVSQFDHKPCFFLYYPESNSVEKIFYPIAPSEKVISLKHIEKKNQTTDRTEKYTNLINEADLSELKTFKENSEIFISKSKNRISKNVIALIRRFVNHERPESSTENEAFE